MRKKHLGRWRKNITRLIIFVKSSITLAGISLYTLVFLNHHGNISILFTPKTLRRNMIAAREQEAERRYGFELTLSH